ncbi:Cryptochrome DASH [Planctomycetes bacterium Poly30]|uniref:Cryptochrome DASH n=1 Tax=Saltatorellus ferox TaxID=2528018 RepID=A0A518ELL0_9BACT|nr:Cryptochrome DASH [Planctomycetes bacterium Poly30]
MKEKGSGPIAVWYRQDLRVADHPALTAAAEEARRLGTGLLGVYCFEDREFERAPLQGWPRTGAFRARFLLESVEELRATLRQLGSDLIVRRGSPARVLEQLALETGLQRIDFHRLMGTEERQVEDELRRALESAGVHVVSHHDRTLHAEYPFEQEKLPEVFTAFRKRVEKYATIAAPLDAPSALPGPPAVDPGEIPSLTDLGLEEPTDDPRAILRYRGGEAAGHERLRTYLASGKLSTYKETRNGLVERNDSAKLSPWLSLGCLSCRTVQAAVVDYEAAEGANESTYWMTFELLWRDYFQLIVRKHGAAVFQPGGLQRFPVEWKHNGDLFEAWRLGRTGYPFVDASMRELLATGFMSNRGRQNVGSFLTKNLGLDWRLGAEWFESQLIDHDVASNYGNWNYVAGVGNDARGFRYFHIPKQARQYDPQGDHARLWVPEVASLRHDEIHTPWELSAARLAEAGIVLGRDYPEPIVDLETSQREQRAGWERAAARISTRGPS